MRKARCWRGIARSAAYESLESRHVMAFDFVNAFNPFDVDDDGFVAPLDALLVINELTSTGPRELPSVGVRPSLLVDVDGDRFLSPGDALQIVNTLNESPPAADDVLLVASLSPDSDPNGNGVVLQSNVTVVGQATPRAWVRLRISDDVERVVATGADGRFQFQVELPAGATTLRLDATDRRHPTVSLLETVRLGDTVLDWNAAMLGVIRDWTTLSNDPYSNRVVTERPPVAARNLAMVHTAMYDVANGILGWDRPYHVDIAAPAGADLTAALASAAQRVASQLYTLADERAVFDASLAEALAQVPDDASRAAGLAYGQQVGDAMLAWRANDGAKATVSYTPGSEPGDWNRTFPDFLPPLIPQWPRVVPFTIPSAVDFRPEAPPPLDSAEYAAAVDEVMRLGRYDSTERTADQTAIALYWADGGGTFTPPGHWNQIAADVSLARAVPLADTVRLFAMLNTALADAGIVAWDAKYEYDLWRPIDAIRRADTDGNAATSPDATWIPLLKTPPFPTYVSGHSTFSGAADAVLSFFFGADVAFTSEADGHNGFRLRPLAESQVTSRSFANFTQAAEEAGLSRIYGGIHFDFDNHAGLAAGRAIGQFIVDGEIFGPAPP